MLDIKLAKEELLKAVEQLQAKKNLAASVTPDYYEPGRMEFLDQYLGVYDEVSNAVTLRTESKGLRYEERTPRLDELRIGDPVQLVREPGNPFNTNNFMILSAQGESLGNLSAELCNRIAPLLDLGYVVVRDARVSYVERIRDRSRYAKQGVLFIEIHLGFKGI